MTREARYRGHRIHYTAIDDLYGWYVPIAFIYGPDDAQWPATKPKVSLPSSEQAEQAALHWARLVVDKRMDR